MGRVKINGVLFLEEPSRRKGSEPWREALAWRELSFQADLSVEAGACPLYRYWSCSDEVHVSSRSGRREDHTEEGSQENQIYSAGAGLGCRSPPSPCNGTEPPS